MHVHYLQVSEKKYARKEEMRKQDRFFIFKITDFCILCSRGQRGDLIM